MRVLIAEADNATAQSLDLMLRSEGFNVFTVDLGEEAVDLASIYDYDAMVLSLELHDMGGMEVLRQIRAKKVRTPIICLSAFTDLDLMLKAFGAGADDFLTKPFHRDELAARLSAVVRRSNGHAHPVITAGLITIDVRQRIVTVAGKVCRLTGKEYQMMELLALRKGATLTKDAFLNHLYGGMDEPEVKIVDVFMCKIRKKLRDLGAGEHIMTVWGRGYVLQDRDQAPGSAANDEAQQALHA